MDSVIIEPAANFIIRQSLSSLSGLFGGLSLSFFWRPPKLHQYGPFVAGAITGTISVMSSFAFAGITARWLGMNFDQADTALALGYIIGAISLGFISLLANFFNQYEKRNLLDVISEIKKIIYSFPSDEKTSRTRRSPNKKRKE